MSINNKTTVYSINSKPREAWLLKTLSEIPDGKSILDAGAGELRNKNYCSHLKYTSQDLGTYDGEGNSEGLQTKEWDTSKIDIKSDITSIPVEDETFDVVLCTEVLEHVSNPIDALNELTRVLKKGGTLILTAPFCSLTHFAPQHYYSGFNKYFYNKVLPELGYKVIECSPNGNYYHYMAQELERLPRLINETTSNSFGIIRKVFNKFLIRYLIKIGIKDSVTSETLCFGYHVVAKKV
jgi:ubiquinone/menaquinone biosynthesis C-methylase UbiE